MKLNTDILYDSILNFMQVRQIGPKIEELMLDRPQFYLKDTKPERYGVYIADASFLPYECTLSEDSLLICVGGPPPHSYIRKNRSIFLIEKEDILSVSNHINEIYRKYDSWEKKLNDIIAYNADIEEMVYISAPFFSNRLMVHSNFRVIAMSEPHIVDGKISGYVRSEGIFMGLDLLPEWIDDFLRARERKDPYFYTSPVGFQYCCNNLFLSGQYMGAVLIEKTYRPFLASDTVCLLFLARYVEAAMEKYNKLNNKYLLSMKSVVANLLDCNPISKQQTIEALNIMRPDFFSGNDRSYLCFIIRPELGRTVPAVYFCDRIEKMFTTCVSLLYENNIVTCAWFEEKELIFPEIEIKLGILLSESKLKAGVSTPFTDITKIRESYKQAVCAFEMGILLGSDKNIHTFSDFVLPYMILNSVGEFSVEFVCPEGLLKLYKNKEASGVDYWKTLTTYLDNNSNAVKTAKDLYLHRNSLYRRLEHIYSVVNVDFNDNDQVFLLRFCVKALELQERIPNFPMGR